MLSTCVTLLPICGFSGYILILWTPSWTISWLIAPKFSSRTENQLKHIYVNRVDRATAWQNLLSFDSWNVRALAKRSIEWFTGINFINPTFSVNHVKSISSGVTYTLKSIQIHVLVWLSTFSLLMEVLGFIVQLVSHAWNCSLKKW